MPQSSIQFWNQETKTGHLLWMGNMYSAQEPGDNLRSTVCKKGEFSPDEEISLSLLKCVQNKSHPRSNAFYQTTTRSPSGVSLKGVHRKNSKTLAEKWHQIFTVKECLQSLKDIDTLVMEEQRYLSEQLPVLYNENNSSVTVEQYYDLTPSKKSNIRVNDEIIPKPTDINVGEKQIKVSIQREHPYQSHIPYCAMFPSYRCPDDPDTGVRATSKLPINPLIPASAPQVTILSKSKGAPYRHEVLDIPMETRQNAATWPGHNGFQNHIKPLKGEVQVFYPTAPKTLCPNLTLRDWKSTLLERTANALRNLEKSHWLTSYQLHFTGTGPTNPIKMDDFNEKTIKLITGEMNPYTAQLMERSYPIFLPPRPPEGRGARILQSQSHLENPCPPYSPSFSPEPPDSGMSFTQTHGPLDSSLSAQLKSTAPPSEEETDKRVHFEQTVKNFEDEKKMKEISCIISPIRQRLARGTFGYGVKKSSKDLGSDLLELQDSFSRSKAHRIFSESLQDATVDLRDNHHTGRKHFFYGFNSYYFHN